MTYLVAASSSGQDCEIVLPAESGQYYTLNHIVYSYSGLLSLGTGTFTVKFGNTKVLEFDIKNEILGSVLDMVGEGYQSAPNESVTITLKGVSGLIGKLSIVYTMY